MSGRIGGSGERARECRALATATPSPPPPTMPSQAHDQPVERTNSERAKQYIFPVDRTQWRWKMNFTVSLSCILYFVFASFLFCLFCSKVPRTRKLFVYFIIAGMHRKRQMKWKNAEKAWRAFATSGVCARVDTASMPAFRMTAVCRSFRMAFGVPRTRHTVTQTHARNTRPLHLILFGW